MYNKDYKNKRLRLHIRVLLIALSFLGFSACSSPSLLPMKTVPYVDLNRYLGNWYEVSMIPNTFQRMCVADTQANYTMTNTWTGDTIQVINRCRKSDGTIEIAKGVAKIVAGSHNAQLKVSFFRPFYGNYWILALGEKNTAYTWVLVGEPKRKFAWILSRTPLLDSASLEIALKTAQDLGYLRTQFVLSKQTNPL